MKFSVFTLTLLATSALAAIEIDWSTVKHIEEYEKFWDDKPSYLRPPARYFSESSGRNRRIVNGQEATPHQFPYQAALLFFLPSIGGSALCGGALVNTRFILTAAHCVDGATSGTVIMGAHNMRIIEPTQQRFTIPQEFIRMHPQWLPSLIQNDIAMVHLPSAAVLNQFVALINLPNVGESNQFANAPATVSGWGRFSDDSPNSSDILRFYSGTILPQLNCAARFPGIIQPSNICLSGLNNGGACQGDSGGPLSTTDSQQNHIHIGVVSFGLALGCEALWPSVFARTTFYNDWIRGTMTSWPTPV